MKNVLMLILVVLNITTANAINAPLEMGPQSYVCESGWGTPPDACVLSVVPAANYFGLDANGNGVIDENERTAINRFKGLVVDGVTIQLASGSHGGVPDGTESPAIDQPWDFFGQTGMHMTTSPVSVVNADVNNDGGFTQTLDFSGWAVIWNNNPLSPLDGGVNGSALATLTCSLAGCATGSQFSLDYSVVIGENATSCFFCSGVFYQLHLKGTVGLGCGDMNGDGLINVVDVLLLQRKVLGLQ